VLRSGTGVLKSWCARSACTVGCLEMAVDRASTREKGKLGWIGACRLNKLYICRIQWRVGSSLLLFLFPLIPFHLIQILLIYASLSQCYDD
jgi:hypothetical protein